ncbi:hypothetical protein [Streptomyces tremellae]|uniref:AB hydrolase-1 domain-containing protein n=1 Tax=Streptomyces tremellae TaxID=1124239 RepID=A0ABP7FCN5_9ACTN
MKRFKRQGQLRRYTAVAGVYRGVTPTPRGGAEFAARLGVRPRMVPGGHLALLDHPEDIATALLELVRAGRDRKQSP